MEKYNVHIEMKEPNGEKFNTAIEIGKEPTKEDLIGIGKEIKESFSMSKSIIIEFQVFNSISGTWMTMSSYYADENRYVKHT